MHPGPRHPPPGASPLHRGSPKFRAEARCPPPASLTAGGCRGTAGGGKPGKKQIVPLGGQGGLGPRSPPAPMPLAVPGSLLANEKAGAAPRCPAFSRGFGAVGFVCPPLGDKLGARAGPRRASAASPHPRCPWPWGKSRFRSFLVQGEGFLGRCAPRPPALPLAPFPRPGAGAWVRFIFGAAKLFIFIFFFLARERLARGGRRGTRLQNDLGRWALSGGFCSAPRGSPGPPRTLPGSAGTRRAPRRGRLFAGGSKEPVGGEEGGHLWPPTGDMGTFTGCSAREGEGDLRALSACAHSPPQIWGKGGA